MKKLLLLTTSPTVGGNGDALMRAAAETAGECGAEIRRINDVPGYFTKSSKLFVQNLLTDCNNR